MHPLIDYPEFYRHWAAHEFNFPLHEIKSVDFDTIYGGYCETCAYETFGVTVTLTNGQRHQYEREAAEVIQSLLEYKA